MSNSDEVPFLSIFPFDRKKANGGAEDDGVLPCKGLLCSVFFFRFGFYVALDGKKV